MVMRRLRDIRLCLQGVVDVSKLIAGMVITVSLKSSTGKPSLSVSCIRGHEKRTHSAALLVFWLWIYERD